MVNCRDERRESANLWPAAKENEIAPLHHIELHALRAKAEAHAANAVDGAGRRQQQRRPLVKPPRAYCTRVSRAIGPNSRCYKHLVLAPMAEDRQEKGFKSAAVASTSEQVRTNAIGDGEMPKKVAERAELVYVRLETIGAKITDLSTQAINERLVRHLFAELVEGERQDSQEKTGQRAKLSANETTSDDNDKAAESELNQIRAQILDSPPGVDGPRQAARCREAVEKTLCRFVYPSCHFKRSEVSALVRPPCREDCLVLRDLYCPNLNLTKFSQVVRRSLNATLMSTLNALDLAVDGDRDSLAAALRAAKLTGHATSTTAAAITSTNKNDSRNKNNGDGGNATTSTTMTRDGQIRFDASSTLPAVSASRRALEYNSNELQNSSRNELLHERDDGQSGEQAPNQSEAPGYKLQLDSGAPSLHFYWPHERSLAECDSLPPLRPLALVAAAGSVRNFGGSGGEDHTMRWRGREGSKSTNNDTRNNNNVINLATAPITSGSSRLLAHWSAESVRRWRQRARNKWPICSNAHLTETLSGRELGGGGHLDVMSENKNPMSGGTNKTKRNTRSTPGELAAGQNLQLDCLASNDGADYLGSWNKTKSGLDCQDWQAQWPHQHKR